LIVKRNSIVKQSSVAFMYLNNVPIKQIFTAESGSLLFKGRISENNRRNIG